MFSREDWTIFRNLNTITHKAGVSLKALRRLVIKELVDNAMDANPGERCEINEIDDDTFVISDTGPGIPGTGEEIAHLFSIRRPLTSSKIVRKPSRGAMGNGLRVVSGVIGASGGTMTVETRGMAYRLHFNDNGYTTVASSAPVEVKGTRITVRFGKSVPRDENTIWWGHLARTFHFAKIYKGKTSPWWYDSDSFFELLQAAGEMPTADLVAVFDGAMKSTVAVAKQIAVRCKDFTRESADTLLDVLRKHRPDNVKPQSIGRAFDQIPEVPYHREFGYIELAPGRGKNKAHLPYCVEAWAILKDDQKEDDSILPFVNGTPIVGDMTIERRAKGELVIFGCGLHHSIDRCSSKKIKLVLNVTIPYMPITTDGKAPDFKHFLTPLAISIRKATRKLKGAVAQENKSGGQTAVIIDNLPAAIEKASGGGQLRFSLRQLYYAIRPYVLEQLKESGDLQYNHFCRVITQYEADNGELAGMYRDPRGAVYHPHTRITFPVGTITVEQYKREPHLFNKVLYCEKEGLFEVLKQAQFPERYDCVLLSSKGFASRAVKDLLDLMGEMDEETHFYCIHDADGPGTMIYQTLQGSTTARAARKVKIHNLGLDPWEARAMDLQVETFGDRKSKTPVAEYIEEHRRDRSIAGDISGERWVEWLQTNRVELNAMTSPQFLAWIEGKMEEYGVKKVIPTIDVLSEKIIADADELVRERIRDEILKANNFEGKVNTKMEQLREKIARMNLTNIVVAGLEKDDSQRWSKPLRDEAEKLAAQ